MVCITALSNDRTAAPLGWRSSFTVAVLRTPDLPPCCAMASPNGSCPPSDDRVASPSARGPPSLAADQARKTSEVQRKETVLHQQDIVHHMAGDKAKERWSRVRKEVLQGAFSAKDADDGAKLIEERLAEVRAMCNHSIHTDFFLSTLPRPVREAILRLKSLSNEEFRRQRRAHWKPIDLFRHAGRMAGLIACLLVTRKRYINKETEDGKEGVEDGGGRESNMCSISKELRNSLITLPMYRTERDLKLILWILRSTKAFTHLFPAEMERICATYVGYEKYDEGRILAYQNVPPMKFYFVIGGKIDRIRQYKLTLGEVNKSLGFVTKGMTTDPEEMEASTPRDCMMVAKGLVEVLVLHRAAYMELLSSTSGPPLDFLRRIAIFREFPCELFYEYPEAIDMRYFGANKVIVRDSTRTPWLHIIKSGSVKVTRRQRVFDADRNRVVLANLARGKQENGESSHAAEMLGLSARQRRLKKETDRPKFNPFGLQRSRTVLPPTLKGRKNGAQLLITPHEMDEEEEMEEQEAPAEEAATKATPEPTVQEPPQEALIVHSPEDSPLHSARIKKDEPLLLLPTPCNAPVASRPKQKPALDSSRDLNIAITEEPAIDPEEEQDAFMTRERIQESQILSGSRSRSEFERATFVQLDTLQAGDVFGFKGIQKRLKDDDQAGLDTHLSEDVGLTLISDGAEVVRISKRFFIKNAENNTMLKVETLYKEYMSEDSAKGLLKDACAWQEYKQLVINRSIAQHSRRLK